MLSTKSRQKTIELNNYEIDPQKFLQQMKEKFEVKSKTPYTALKEVLRRFGGDRSIRRLERNLKFSAAFLRKDSTNVGTLQNRFTELKRLYLDIYEGAQEDMITSILSLSPAEVNEKISKQKAALRSNLQNKIDIGKDEIKNAIDTLRKSKDWHDKVLLIMLATGRRLIEVLKLSHDPLKNKSGDLVWFNLAKGRKDPVYAPLLFIDYDELLKAWILVRKNVKSTGTNKEITNRYNAALNNRVKELLPALKGTHGLRAVYGKTATETKKPREMDSVLYLNKILGHHEDTLETALYYKKINLEEKTPERRAPKPNKTVLRLVEAMEKLSRNEPGYSTRRLIKEGFSYHTIKRYREDAEKIIAEKKKKEEKKGRPNNIEEE
jgi:hypothetical protein